MDPYAAKEEGGRTLFNRKTSLCLDSPNSVFELFDCNGLRVPIDFEDYSVVHPFALAAIGAAVRDSGEGADLIVPNLAHDGTRWALHGMGLQELVEGRDPYSPGEEGRTAKLRRVIGRADTSGPARKTAKLVSPNCAETAELLSYVFDELIRNAIQHSEDPKGAVVCAQRMDPRFDNQPTVIQVSVADTGMGIPRSLSKSQEDEVDGLAALSMAIEPHMSGAFVRGTYGSSENAGLGLFVTTEIVKRTAGRLLLASRGGSLLVNGDPEFSEDHRIETIAAAYPGTCVAFELQVIGDEDSVIPGGTFSDLLEAVLSDADDRKPGSGYELVLDYGSKRLEGRLMAITGIGSLENAERIRRHWLPRVKAGEYPVFDFLNLTAVTQSQAHSLLFDLIRAASREGGKIGIANASPTVESVLNFLQSYALRRHD